MIEQKIREILRQTCRDSAETGKCLNHNNCSGTDCSYTKQQTKDILAALQPAESFRFCYRKCGNEYQFGVNGLCPKCLQPDQPAEGELAPFPFGKGNVLPILGIGEWNEVCETQYQHMIAQGYVKLPSEEELEDKLLPLIKHRLFRSGFDVRGFAKELHRLLREEK